MSVNAKQVGGDHYKADFQHWDFVMACNLNYLQGNATKYVDRCYRKHDSAREDLEKAIHYLEKQIVGGYAIVLHNGQWKHMQRYAEARKLTPEQYSIIWAIVSGQFELAIRVIEKLLEPVRSPATSA